MGTVNLAAKYSNKVDEAFKRASIKQFVTNNDYEWAGVKTVNVYSIPVVDLTDYTRSGANRYGTPSELETEVQELTISKDRAWTFTIDKLNKNQSQMVMDAGKAVARQLALKVIPEVDTYTFRKMALAAQTAGNKSTTAATKSNAYELFLAAQEHMGNANVPDEGRIALVSYAYAGLLKQNTSFMRDCDTTQNALFKGMIGMIDGCKIIQVPSSRLPSTTVDTTTTVADFILAHPIATVAPTVLSEYKIHTDAPGISGWLCEGRISYDAFVLNSKKDAIWYQGPALS